MLKWQGANSGWDSGHGDGESVCWSPERAIFVAVGRFSSGLPTSAVCHTSGDGISWTKRSTATAPALSTWTDVCWSPALSLFVAVGVDRNTGPPFTNTVWTSPDGTTWTPRGIPVSSSASFSSCVWAPALGLFVIAGGITGTGQVIATSPDGINWTGRTSPLDNLSTRGICWSPALNLLVVVSAESGKQIMTSPDGTNWTNRTGHSFLYAYKVCWSPTYAKFYATGPYITGGANPGIESSPDGVTWTPIAGAMLSTNSYGGVVEAFDTMILVGDHDGGKIWESRDGTTFTAQTVQISNGLCYSPDYSLAVSAGAGSVASPVYSIYTTQPLVVTDATTSDCSTATLNGTITPNTDVDHPVTWFFDWGLSPGVLSHSTPFVADISGLDPVAVSAVITGLIAGTTYYYRVNAYHNGGTTFVRGSTLSFTPTCPDVPSLDSEFSL